METQNWVPIKQHKQQKITDLETNKLHRSELHTHTQEAPRRYEKGKGGKKHEINKKEHRQAETTLGEKIALFLHKSSLVQKKTCHPNASLFLSPYLCLCHTLSLSHRLMNKLNSPHARQRRLRPPTEEGRRGWVSGWQKTWSDLIWSESHQFLLPWVETALVPNAETPTAGAEMRTSTKMLPAIATKKNFREEKGFVKCFWRPATC